MREYSQLHQIKHDMIPRQQYQIATRLYSLSQGA